MPGNMRRFCFLLDAFIFLLHKTPVSVSLPCGDLALFLFKTVLLSGLELPMINPVFVCSDKE